MATEKRLIDADAEIATVKENICKNCNSYNGVQCRACWVDSMIGFIDDAPIVDAVEVVHGRWIKVADLCGLEVLKCSACGREHPRLPTAYCCDCGAKMDKNENP